MTAAPPPDGGRESGQWAAARLLDAPHRLCFFFAGCLWAASALWWAADLVAATLDRSWVWRVPATAAHGLWFSLGSMPLFIAGFMCTAGAKWLRRPPVVAKELRLAVGLFSVGWGLAVAGFHVGPTLTAVGLTSVTVGWGALTWRIVRLVSGSTHDDRRHPWLIACACIVIAGCLAMASLALAAGRVDLLQPVVRVALWGGILTVFLAVSHRLLPFLGAGAWPWMDAHSPAWPLWLVLSVPVVRSAGVALDVGRVSLPGWRVFEGVHLAVVAALCLWIALRWIGAPALRQPLVAMLFGAFLWWDGALWLGAAARLSGVGAGTAAALDLAALHALTMGYLGGTLLVMVTRVSSTLSGRPVAIDRVARVLYGVLQLAVILRLVAAVAAVPSGPLLASAALAWMSVAVVWATRHGRWLGSPRIDGRCG